MKQKRDKQHHQITIKKRNQQAFLAAFAERGLIKVSAMKAGITRGAVFKWLQSDKEFIEQFREVEQLVCDKLEAEMHRRGVDGYDEPVFYRGVKVGAIRRYSDQLLTLALKSRMPEKYRERFETRITKSDDEIDNEIQRELEELASGGSLALPGTDSGAANEATNPSGIGDDIEGDGGSDGSAENTTS